VMTMIVFRFECMASKEKIKRLFVAIHRTMRSSRPPTRRGIHIQIRKVDLE
jgi:hypothetical protein